MASAVQMYPALTLLFRRSMRVENARFSENWMSFVLATMPMEVNLLSL